MRNILVIAKKDLKTLFSSSIFYVVCTFCTILWGIIFATKFLMFSQNFMAGQETNHNIHGEVFLTHISSVNLLFILLVPALTMRLLAEEKKQRTIDLLLTSPLTSTQIVLGKYLAGLGGVLFLIALSFLYPIMTAFMAEIQWGPLLSTYLGLILISGIYVAIGLFASSLTESVVLSVVMGLIFNLLFWFIGMTAERTEIPYVTSIIEYLSVGQHFMAFAAGSIKLNAAIFFLSCAGFFVFLAQRVVEFFRWRA